jgi:hypothetical protein
MLLYTADMVLGMGGCRRVLGNDDTSKLGPDLVPLERISHTAYLPRRTYSDFRAVTGEYLFRPIAIRTSGEKWQAELTAILLATLPRPFRFCSNSRTGPRERCS